MSKLIKTYRTAAADLTCYNRQLNSVYTLPVTIKCKRQLYISTIFIDNIVQFFNITFKVNSTSAKQMNNNVDTYWPCTGQTKTDVLRENNCWNRILADDVVWLIQLFVPTVVRSESVKRRWRDISCFPFWSAGNSNWIYFALFLIHNH